MRKMVEEVADIYLAPWFEEWQNKASQALTTAVSGVRVAKDEDAERTAARFRRFLALHLGQWLGVEVPVAAVEDDWTVNVGGFTFGLFNTSGYVYGYLNNVWVEYDKWRIVFRENEGDRPFGKGYNLVLWGRCSRVNGMVASRGICNKEDLDREVSRFRPFCWQGCDVQVPVIGGLDRLLGGRLIDSRCPVLDRRRGHARAAESGPWLHRQ